ncbi:MAG: tetratricopeptide repeat protein [Symploca sp. SIO1C2]|nr:tetratricopeptide repeat protein [Symploca sp. SIO1C2]
MKIRASLPLIVPLVSLINPTPPTVMATEARAITGISLGDCVQIAKVRCKKGCIPSPDGCICGRGTRSDETFTIANIPYILSPRSTYLLDNQPLLRWYAVDGATSYRVRVKREDGELLWETEVKDVTEVRYGGEPLESDVDYTVIVNTDTGASSLEEELEGGGFEILSAEEQEEIQAAASKLTQSLTGAEQVLALGEFYQQNGLFAEAIALLESLVEENNQIPAAYQQLGELYQYIRFPPLAAENYLKAIALTEDTATIAQLQEKLGGVYRILQQPDKAIDWLEQAEASYQTLGNSQKVREIQRQIEQIQSGL